MVSTSMPFDTKTAPFRKTFLQIRFGGFETAIAFKDYSMQSDEQA